MAWNIQIDAGLSGFEASVKKMPKTLATATGQMDRSMQGLAKSSSSAGQGITKAKEATANLGAAISVLSPEAGKVVMQLSALEGAGKAATTGAEALGISMSSLGIMIAPVAIAAGALALVWWDLSRAEKAAAEEGRKAAEVATQQQKVYETLTSVILDVDDAYRIATGAITSNGLAGEKTASKLTAAFEAERKLIQGRQAAAEQEGAALDMEIASQERWVASRAKMADVVVSPEAKAADAEKLATLRTRRDALTRSEDAQMAALNSLGQREKEELDRLGKTIRLQDQKTKSINATTQALMAEKQAYTSLFSAAERSQMAATAKGYADVSANLADMRSIADEANAKLSEMGEAPARGIAAINKRYDAELERIKELSGAWGADQNLVADAMAQNAKNRAADVSQYTMDLASTVAGSTADMIGSFSDFASVMADKGGAASKKWAKRAHAAALGQVIASGFVAEQMAWTSAPFPWNLPAIAATGIATAANIAGVQATKYHVGLSRAPDEVPALLTDKERVLTGKGAAALGGDERVAAANRGEAPGQVLVVQQVYGHRVLGEIVRNDIGMPRSQLRSAIRSLSRSPAAGRIR